MTSIPRVHPSQRTNSPDTPGWITTLAMWCCKPALSVSRGRSARPTPSPVSAATNSWCSSLHQPAPQTFSRSLGGCTTPSRTQSSPMSTPSPSAPVSALPASTRPGQQRPPIFYARPMPPCIRPKRQVRAKPDSCRYIRPPLGTDPTQTRVIPLRRPNAGCRYAAGNVGHSQLARRARYIALSARCTLPSESVCPSIVVRSPPHRHKALIPVT